MKSTRRALTLLLATLLIASLVPIPAGFACTGRGGHGARHKPVAATYPVARIAPVSLDASAAGTFKVCLRLAPDATSTITTSSIEITSINGSDTSIFALSASVVCTTGAVARFDRATVTPYLVNGTNTFTLAFTTDDGTPYTVTATAKGIVHHRKKHHRKHGRR